MRMRVTGVPSGLIRARRARFNRRVTLRNLQRIRIMESPETPRGKPGELTPGGPTTAEAARVSCVGAARFNAPRKKPRWPRERARTRAIKCNGELSTNRPYRVERLSDEMNLFRRHDADRRYQKFLNVCFERTSQTAV